MKNILVRGKWCDFFGLGFVFLVVLLLLMESAYGETRYRKFKQEEVRKMFKTKGTIGTKFGNIELKFFPEVAPNHANNFIDLAKKNSMMGRPSTASFQNL